MKVVSICYDDYANFMHDNAKALRSVGVDCQDFKMIPHKFGYQSQAVVASRNDMEMMVREADVVQIFHSCLKSLNMVDGYTSRKKVIVYHTGTAYRDNPRGMNEKFNHLVHKVLTDQCEFMHLGGKEIEYIATAVDTDKLIPEVRRANVPYQVAHYPSKSDVKGTEDINRMMFEFLNMNLTHRYNYKWSKEQVSHEENLKRMMKCDVYIELYSLELNGRQYGCYGVSAFEAAAMGKVVMTQNVFPNVYVDAYGCELPFLLTHSEIDFQNKLANLIAETNIEFNRKQEQTREWVVKNHSYKATGEYLKKIILGS